MPKRKTANTAALTKKVYHVAKTGHNMTRGLLGHLFSQLGSVGWHRASDVVSSSSSYTDPVTNDVTLLCKFYDVVEGRVAATSYAIGATPATLADYCTVETMLDSHVFNGVYTVAETRWRKQGTAECIVVSRTLKQIAAIATAGAETHAILEEAYAETKYPGVLYSAVDDIGDLWELLLTDEDPQEDQ